MVKINMKSDTLIEHIQYFKESFLKYYGMLCVYAMQYTEDADISRDIVQDCFADLWEKRDKLDYTMPLKPLLYKSVHDKAIDYTRHSSTKNESLNTDIEEHPLDIKWREILGQQPDDEIDCGLIRQEVDRCVAELSPQCARIYKMSREEGLSNKEIAARLQVSIKSVEKQITKALSTIRYHLLNRGYLSLIFYALFFLPRR